MTDTQRLVDEIRAFLQGTDQTLTERHKELARLYAEACREVNQRLRRCEEYLKKGLRGEAIHFAQAEPILLDEVALLEFPELTLLQECLRANGLPEPPGLQLDIAQDLNKAYAVEQPLEEDLLPRHRRLALLRAPVSERLQVMRQIAKIDKDNPVWGDDIRLFEAARFREIQTVMEGPAKGDASRMEELARELSEPGWFLPPPALLAEQVRKQSALLIRERARLEFGPLLEELNAAMNRNDLAAAQTLSDRYYQLKMQAQLADTDLLVQKAARPLQWLSQKERAQQRDLEVQTALAALEEALTRRADPEEAWQLHDEALRLVRTLPTRLEERYQTYLYEAGATRRWRENLILIIAVIVGLLFLVGLIGVLMVKSKSRPAASDVSWLVVSCPRTFVNCPPICIDHPRGARNG